MSASDPLASAQRLAIGAINDGGAELYNKGDIAGCAALYARTITAIMAGRAVPDAARSVLERGLRDAGAAAGDADSQAWALRGALDALIELRSGGGGGSAPSAAPGGDSGGGSLSFAGGLPGRWGSIDDSVMGGRSRSEVSPDPALGAAVFSGVVSTADNGGFASVRGQGLRLDLRAARALTVTAMSRSAATFKLSLHDSGAPDMSHQHSFRVPGDGKWHAFTLPLSQFMATRRGQPQDARLDRARVQAVGFLLSKLGDRGEATPDFRAGPFALAVRSIEVE